MLSLETETLVSKLLLTIADSEKAVEVVRQVLGDQLDFEPFMVFRYLDRADKNFLDEFDITDFLK